MKSLSTLLVVALGATSAFAAESDVSSAVKAAAAALGSKGNYSWTATIRIEGGSQNFRMGPTEGKTDKNGWSYTTASFNDNKFETVYKGGNGAFKRDDEWQTAEDLEGDDRGAWMARRLRTFKAPAAEAEDLVAHVKGMQKGEGGLYSGDLTEEGAKTLLTRVGRRGGDGPSGARGTAKFWMQDGVLSKFEYQVQGSFKRDDGEDRVVNRTTTTEIKDVGTHLVYFSIYLKIFWNNFLALFKI
jgi:hypothetical protein